MITTSEPSANVSPTGFVHLAVKPKAPVERFKAAARRIAPLWPLTNFVAVNPYLGFADQHFAETFALMDRVTRHGTKVSNQFVADDIAQGRITEGDMWQALETARRTLPPVFSELAAKIQPADLLKTLLKEEPPANSASKPKMVETVADAVDKVHGTRWAPFITNEISKWCAAYYDKGQSLWPMPWRHLSLFKAWKQAARHDANPAVNGLAGFQAFAAKLPEQAADCIAEVLQQLGVPERGTEDFLHREWMSLAGWSGHARYLQWQKELLGQEDDAMLELLAVRLAYEGALYAAQKEAGFQSAWQGNLARLRDPFFPLDGAGAEPLLHALLRQLAMESAFQRKLMSGIAREASSSAFANERQAKKSVQAVFCIDVRSEVYRKSLESLNPGIQTLGFAGFFGFAVEWAPFGETEGSARCPVLLAPKYRVPETQKTPVKALSRLRVKRQFSAVWSAFKNSAVSCFPFVETAGWLSSGRLAQAAAGIHPETSRPAPQCAPCLHSGSLADAENGIPFSDQIQLARGALCNMSLTRDFARLVLFCGHGGASANNPHASSLACGACGGHSGDANARIAVTVLNSPAVRSALKSHGIAIPAETWFIAGLHETTTDEVSLFETESAPESHKNEIAQLRQWLNAASKATRKKRAEMLGLGDLNEEALEKAVFERSRDWAQVRPEWGLAGNAAFVAAPRSRTSGLDLGGRVFLHDYNPSDDAGLAVLELVMCAPMVVASWINLQYYASTVNNEEFGSGNKVTHNVAGSFAVLQGNGGDLRPGLPLQSVFDGRKWAHQPVRLNVFIETSRESVERVLSKHQSVRDLIDNGWVVFHTLEEGGRKFARRISKNEWEEVF